MLGFPPEDEALFRHFVHQVIEQVDLPVEERLASFEQLDEYLDRQVREHAEHPRDDLTTYLMNVELDGNKLAPRARARLDRAAADRRHRHHVERDRVVAVAPRHRTPTTCSDWSTNPT